MFEAGSQAQHLPDLVAQALNAGEYVRAEELAATWCTYVETEHGAESLEIARALDLLVASQVKNGKSGAPGTVQIAERAVGLKQLRLGTDHLETASSVHNLGAARMQRGEFAAALRMHERAFTIRYAALGRNDPAVADSLDEMASALIQLERFEQARNRLGESLRIRESAAAASPLALARTLELNAVVDRYSGRYLEALAPLDRAFTIRSRLSPDHPDAILPHQVRGDILLLTGDTVGAQATWTSALSLAERTLRPNHPAVAEVLRRLGLAAFSLGDLGEARRLRERALRIGEESLAQCDPTAAGLAIGVAVSLQYDGEYADSRRVLRRALKTARDCAKLGHAPTADVEATLLINDAGVAREVGDLGEADRLYEQAVGIWSKGLGPDHPFVAKGLDPLAEVAASRGQFARARALYERALAIRRSKLGPRHPQVAWTLTSLARTVGDSGNLPLALRHVEEAIAIYAESGVSDEPDHLARVLELRGSLEASRANLAAARASLVQALAERNRIFGSAHPVTAETRVSIARIDFAQGAAEAALDAALDVEQAGLSHLRFTARYLPERQAMTYAEKRPRGLDLALSIAASGAAAEPARLFDSVIKSRGAVLDEFAARSRVAGNADQEGAALNARVTNARRRFANLVVRSLHDTVPRPVLDEAREEKEESEREVAEHSAESRAEMERTTIGLEGIRQALPTNSVLISFVRYDRRLGLTAGQLTEPAPIPSYAAFVIESRSNAPVFVRLGAAAKIDGLVTAWRAEVSGRSLSAGRPAARVELSYMAAASGLRESVWDPVARHTGAATRVFVVPDGLLNVVSFAALPDGEGRYLAERVAGIHYLSTERDLVVTDSAVVGTQSLVAVGGPAFDSSVATPKAAMLRSACQPIDRLRFEDLPGSLNEAMEISKLWSSTSGNAVSVLTGRAAGETAVKHAITGHRVVHLATHGFFLGSSCTPTLAGTRSVGGLATASQKTSPRQEENPLLLAGLAFAGANNRHLATVDEDDGILTAEEIAGINLHGTEWAVLSACDTGLGEIRNGEGVFGLRRAFQVAGARTVIMSLWSIEDQSALLWMHALYEGRLHRHLSTADAVHAATLEVLRDRRANGKSTHPFYWAAFVAAGAWQ